MLKKLLFGSFICLFAPLTIAANPPHVAVDIAPVHSLVAQVMEGVGKPDLIIQPGASPHSYSMRPSEAEALQRADVVFYVSTELTPWIVTPLENLAGSANKVELLEVAGITLHKFREGATFEAHEHHDEEHADKDEHGHEDHAFEWAGVFDLTAGTYKWSFAKVSGDYADPVMKMVILESDDIEASEEMAEELLESNDLETKRHSDVLVAKGQAYVLSFDESKETTVFSVAIKESGKYAFFTEHMPFEFEANEHFFKDDSGKDVEPIAQEPETGHHHDHHGEHDPHAWLDPENAKIWLQAIAKELSRADATNAPIYQRNAANAIEELDALITTMHGLSKDIEGIKFIVFHDAYQYFEQRFGLQASGAISLGDASDPSPARVKEIRDAVSEWGIRCVFTEPQYNPEMAHSVFENTQVGIIGVMDPLGVDIKIGTGHYSSLLKALLSSLEQCHSQANRPLPVKS